MQLQYFHATTRLDSLPVVDVACLFVKHGVSTAVIGSFPYACPLLLADFLQNGWSEIRESCSNFYLPS